MHKVLLTGMKSAKEATFFKDFNQNLNYLSRLYERVLKKSSLKQERMDRRFRGPLDERVDDTSHKIESDSGDSDLSRNT